MDRTNGAGHIGHQFVAENTVTLQPPSEVTAEWLNMIQEELAAFPEFLGWVLDPNNNHQVLQAVIAMIEARVGDYALDVGTANNYVIALNPAISAYGGNFFFSFKALNANTGASTINFGGGAVVLANDVGGALENGDITAGMIVSGNFSFADDQARITSMVQSQTVKPDQITVAQDFRLSLTTGLPVTAADVIAAVTVYAVPMTGNRIGLWNGAWANYSTAQMSLALGVLASATIPQDVFCYLNAGVPTLEILAWASTTARNTALAYQDGILVKSGDSTRRYLGSFAPTAATTTEDSVANRFLWNYYHRVARRMARIETTSSWTYASSILRQARASTSNQLNFFCGVAEDPIHASLNSMCSCATSGDFSKVGLALDSTTALTAANGDSSSYIQTAGTLNKYEGQDCTSEYPPQIGKHYIAWLESSIASGVFTYYGSLRVAGITGRIMA